MSETNSLVDAFCESGMVPCEHHNPHPSFLAPIAGMKGNLNPPDEGQLCVADGEDCWKQALEGVLYNISSYQDRKKSALRNIVGAKESLDKRIYHLQQKELELSNLFKGLQVENEGLKEVVSLQQQKERRLQELEEERKKKEGHPSEMERLAKLVENKVALLGSVQQALDQYMKRVTEEPRLPNLDDRRAVEDQQQLSDRATLALESVDESYKKLLSCVPLMDQKLKDLQNQLRQGRTAGEELEYKMEEIESKLEGLNRDLERLYAIYKKAGAHSEDFQTTIQELEVSIANCRENIDKMENETMLL